ncbi:MAG TPA: carbohydrate ABC transporter permease [bacterium]|nr:carbohydrate ABC transporter permease [bacterium]HPN31973.1 carbohydrate ABC transporter permease [bacterium]
MNTDAIRKINSKFYNLLSLFILLFFAVIYLTPLYWMTVTAFSSPESSLNQPPNLYPRPFYAGNFKDILSHPDIFRWTFNSMFVSIAVTIIYVYMSAMSGYVLAKYDFKGKKIIFGGYVVSMMIPFQVIIVPLYILCSKLGLNDSYYGLILPAVSAPFGVFLMKQMMNNFQYELVEAAKLDGYSEFGIFNKIVLPLSLPGITTLATFTFIGEWNSFLWPLIIAESTKMKVLQAGIVHLQTSMPMNHSYLMAAAFYSAVPVIAVFFIFQKYFLKGVKIGNIS